jgi:hypothetical protein
MSEILGRIAGFEFAGLPSLPVWMAGAVAALLLVAGVFSFRHSGRADRIGVAARVALILVGAVAGFLALEAWSRLDLRSERRELDARAQELFVRATLPGSAFACLDPLVGDVVESACEKAIFQTPEATAAALSYVATELALLADFTVHARKAGSEIPLALGKLRRSIEGDRFGLVARVLAVHDGCTPGNCPAFALLTDPGRIAVNLSGRSYELYVERHAAAWPAGAKSPVVAATSAGAGAGEGDAQPPAASAPRGGLFFPSAASIPPVTIMNAEPQLPPETTGSTPPSAPPSAAAKQAPAASRRPAQSGGAPANAGNAQSARPPIDLNVTSRTGPPASPPQ